MKTTVVRSGILSVVAILTLNAQGQDIHSAFELERLNVVYRGIENSIRILTTTQYDSLRVKGGILYKDEESCKDCFIVKPDASQMMTIEIYKGSVVVASRDYRIKLVPKPELLVGQFKNGDKVSRLELSTLADLRCVNFSFDFDVKWDVMSYKVTRMVNGEIDKYFEIKEIGQEISPSVKQFLLQCREDDKLFFVADVKGPDGLIYRYTTSLVVR